MDEQKEVVITYETLFELLRIEKSRADLQKLEPSFFDDVVSYLKEKESVLSGAEQTSLFEAPERDRVKIELDNIRRIIRELYNRREKKIIEMAMNKSRTGTNLITTSAMLSIEKDLYESLTGNLGDYRKNVLLNLLNGRLPGLQSSDLIVKEAPMVQSNLEAEPKTEASQTTPSQALPEALKTEPSAGSKVRFLSPVGEIVGPDLQIYGPFEAGVVTDLPEALSKALINKGQAEHFNEALRTAV